MESHKQKYKKFNSRAVEFFVYALILIVLILTVLIEPIVAEKEVFSGKVLTGKEATIDDKIFTFLYDLNSEKTFVDFSTSNIIIDRGECDTREGYRICIDRANFSSRNYTTYTDTYELGIRVYKVTPELAINRTVTPSTLLQGEKGIIKIVIGNPSDFEVTDIVYKDDFSKFEISEIEGCDLREDMIYWKGSLKLRNSKECSFKIVAYKKLNAEIKANITYYDGFSTINTLSPPLSISVKDKQLKVYTSKPPLLEPLISFQYSITLQNLDSKEGMSIHSSALFPSYIKIKRKPDEFWIEGNELNANINLKPSEKKNFTLTLEPNAAGDAPVRHRFGYTLKDLDDKVELEDGIFVKDITPEISIILSNEAPKPGEKFVIIADLKNPSIYHNFKNIKAELASEFSEAIVNELKTLKLKESYRIISNTLIAPDDIEKRQYTLNLTLFYELNDKTHKTGKTAIIGKIIPDIALIKEGNESNKSMGNVGNVTQFTNETKTGEDKKENKTVATQEQNIQTAHSKEEGATKPESTRAEKTPSKIALPDMDLDFSVKNVLVISVFVLFGVLVTLRLVFKKSE